ncbi:uncharacterized protein F5891DRAFT_1070177 [Suillus fuscotomentosus]|uniref:Uncharacterized protein n=1 Tax=Suillus fuscotomentosus TaxID=1912939 RepID=A0AAD4DSP6_9AGAM|nr:uncharacterized protein F5891DRAFT_1070177 [Suillus fuscotomentosus]KAG1891559.1 hypothetical protein F5891DRAFT_1070177 [Suillus fuscotomentosus]
MSFLLPVSDLTNLQTVKVMGSLAILRSRKYMSIRDCCSDHTPQVQWTWSRPWDVTRVIFIISRYLPFAGVGMTAYDALRVSNQSTVGLTSLVALLVIRTWAFWQKSKNLLIGLIVYSVLTIIAAIAADLAPTMMIPGEEPPLGTCYFESTRNAAIVYLFLVIFESVMLILNVYKRIRDYKDFQSGIIVTLYHGGMFYMFCILSVTLANVIFEGALPSAYSNMFDSLQLVVHSVLASRILFRLRDSNERVHVPSMSVMTLDTRINYLRPSSMSMSGMGTTSEVRGNVA